MEWSIGGFGGSLFWLGVTRVVGWTSAVTGKFAPDKLVVFGAFKNAGGWG